MRVSHRCLCSMADKGEFNTKRANINLVPKSSFNRWFRSESLTTAVELKKLFKIADYNHFNSSKICRNDKKKKNICTAQSSSKNTARRFINLTPMQELATIIFWPFTAGLLYLLTYFLRNTKFRELQEFTANKQFSISSQHRNFKLKTIQEDFASENS